MFTNLGALGNPAGDRDPPARDLGAPGPVVVQVYSREPAPVRGTCCCLLLQDLCKSCAREESEERGRVLWDATSRGLCGRVGPPKRKRLHMTTSDFDTRTVARGSVVAWPSAGWALPICAWTHPSIGAVVLGAVGLRAIIAPDAHEPCAESTASLSHCPS